MHADAEDATVVEEVVVTGYRDAQANALRQQRAADNIMNVVSTDALGQFPDISVAESVARIAGVAVTRHRGEADAAVIRGGDPSWTKVTLDGMNIPDAGGGRSVALGQLTSEVLAAVEITKAPTPDMDADAVGGTINIVTRGALTAGRGVSGNLTPGYSELGGNRNYNANLRYARVFGDISRHGLLASISHNVLDREMNNKESSHRLLNDEWMPDRLQTKAYNIKRERSALELRYDFLDGSDKHHLFTSYTFSRYLADEDRHTVIIRNRNQDKFVAGSNALQGVWPGVRIEQNWTDRLDESRRHLLTFGGKSEFEGLTAEYRGSYSQAENIRKPGRASWTYRGDYNNRRLRYDYSDPDFPILTFADNGEVPGVGINVEPDSLSFRYGSNYLQERTQDETAYQLQAKFEAPLSLADLPFLLRFGGKYTSRDRQDDENRYIITAGAPRLSEVLSDKRINNFDRFPFGYRFDKDIVRSHVDGLKTEESIEASWSNDFSIKEQIAAAYVMGVVDAGPWRVVGGVRAEHTRTDSQGWRSDDNWATEPTATEFGREYTNFFPSLHVKYAATDNLILRASYSSAIARPSFSDMRPTVSVNREAETISARNMELKPATSQALDLMAEYYFNPVGVLSLGVFVKRIEDVHFSFSRVVEAGEDFNGFITPEAGWRLTSTVNGDRAATVKGLEATWDQALTFLPAPFDGLGVFSNYSYIETESYVPETGESAPLGLQPKHTFNFAVYYEKGPLSTRLAYNHQTRGISDYGDGTAGNFLWWDERGILDWTARYQLRSNLTLVAEAGNLTDSRARRYRGDRARVEELEDFGRTYSLGLRFRF